MKKLNNEETEKYLKTIAHFLGEGWRLDSRETHNTYLINGKYSISVRADGYRQSEKGKMFFRGLLPRNKIVLDRSESIGVSYSRTPQAVANDIKKRLLPNYYDCFDVCLKTISEYKKKEEEEEAFINLIKNNSPLNELCEYREELNGKLKNGIAVNYIKTYNRQFNIRDISKEQIIKLLFFLDTI